MSNEYRNMPSFYNNSEFFNQYLKQTSSYVNALNVLDKMLVLLEPRRVLELGSNYSIQLASKQYLTSFVCVNTNIPQITNKGQNVSFLKETMCQTVTTSLEKYDLIFSAYTLHTIVDPICTKIEFLQNCYNNMKKGSYLLLIDTFLPEDVNGIDITKLWDLRSKEMYVSTFWNSLQDITRDGLDFAHIVATTAKREEKEQLKIINERKRKYLVTFSWLIEEVKNCGFKTIVAEPLNCVFDNVLLLKK